MWQDHAPPNSSTKGSRQRNGTEQIIDPSIHAPISFRSPSFSRMRSYSQMTEDIYYLARSSNTRTRQFRRPRATGRGRLGTLTLSSALRGGGGLSPGAKPRGASPRRRSRPGAGRRPGDERRVDCSCGKGIKRCMRVVMIGSHIATDQLLQVLICCRPFDEMRPENGRELNVLVRRRTYSACVRNS